MELKYLNTFRIIVEEGGFSKAAERLNYTQSTITFQICLLYTSFTIPARMFSMTKPAILTGSFAEE